jgi:F-type H+-transporting ATPase subunit b
LLNIFGLQICTADFLWTIISFFLFMFLLNKILFKPVLKLMDERKARIDADLENGKQARAALKENEAQLAQELAQTGADARGVINSARSEAEKAKGEVLDTAHAQAEKLHKGVRERVKAKEEAAESEIDDSMPELVAILSDKLLGSEAANDKELIAECIKDSAQ